MLTHKLKFYRLQKDLTLHKLSAKVGISPSALCQIETGRISPSIKTLEKIANVLGIAVGEFFEKNKGNRDESYS